MRRLTPSTMPADAASRTAVPVCRGRAVGQGRLAVGRFEDPVAMEVLRDGERRPVERARSGLTPRAWRDRYQAPALSAAIGRRLAQLLTRLARRGDPWAHEPPRSSWTSEAMRALLAAQGFATVRDDDLLTVAERLGIFLRNRRSLQLGLVAMGDR